MSFRVLTVLQRASVAVLLVAQSRTLHNTAQDKCNDAKLIVAQIENQWSAQLPNAIISSSMSFKYTVKPRFVQHSFTRNPPAAAEVTGDVYCPKFVLGYLGFRLRFCQHF